MSSEKNVLIVTDDNESIDQIARSIQNALASFKVKVCRAEKFVGTDLLPVETFFLGCDKPAPESFAYLEDMLARINLSSRKCGIFSTNAESLEYLRGLVKDCEVSLGEPFLFSDDKDNSVKNWLNWV